ncbi:MAG TPA: helix-turn-helix transcriptional regulator [bacterium]|jgi:DNA-binding Xre family transcriptional regulator|nr:helix-turn-helix transcriptional regulator [bacterium]
MKPTQKRVIKNIEALMIAKTLTIGQLSREVGIDTSNLSKMLRGERQINLDHLGELARGLDVDVQVLLKP